MLDIHYSILNIICFTSAVRRLIFNPTVKLFQPTLGKAINTFKISKNTDLSKQSRKSQETQRVYFFLA